jgi:hypothetical protein
VCCKPCLSIVLFNLITLCELVIYITYSKQLHDYPVKSVQKLNIMYCHRLCFGAVS